MKLATGFVGAAAAIVGLTSGCVYNTPRVGVGSVFNDVATVSSTDIWAVGVSTDATPRNHALIEHFDGHTWTVAAAPSGVGSYLSSVTAVSANDVWAVGDGRTLHWSGHVWHAAADPSGLELTSVDHGHGGVVMGIARQPSTGKYELLNHTATGWQPVSHPTPPLASTSRSCDQALQLEDLTLETPSDVWVAGESVDNATNPTDQCPYAAHWNGSTWSTYAIPGVPGEKKNYLLSISARGPNDVWAVGHAHGFDEQFDSDYSFGIAVHWDGQTWKNVCTGDCAGVITGVDARGTSVWMVGTGIDHLDISFGALLERWSGTRWVAQPMQAVGKDPDEITGPDDFLTSVSARGGTVASGGYFLPGGGGTYSLDGKLFRGGALADVPLIDVRADK
jgi:hypothetical protein